jgi:hypothetical protein
MARKSDETASHEDAPLGGDQVQKAGDENRQRGYDGTVPDGPSNDDYALTSGPDSPSALDAQIAAAEARLADLKASKS